MNGIEITDSFVEELLSQPPMLITNDELANYKQRAHALLSNAYDQDKSCLWAMVHFFSFWSALITCGLSLSVANTRFLHLWNDACFARAYF